MESIIEVIKPRATHELEHLSASQSYLVKEINTTGDIEPYVDAELEQLGTIQNSLIKDMDIEDINKAAAEFNQLSASQSYQVLNKFKRKNIKREFKSKLDEIDKASPSKRISSEKNISSSKFTKQMFRKEWLQLPEFKDWLTEGLHPYYGFCIACNLKITAGKSEIQRHSQSKRHIKNFANKESLNELSDLTAIVDESGGTHIIHIIDMRSDSLSTPSDGMKQAMVKAPTGDTAFNTDQSVRDLENTVAMMLKKESALFFPTHTMANLVACLAHCQSRGSAVFAGRDSDVTVCNKEALVKFGGIHFTILSEFDDSSFDLEELRLLLTDTDLRFPLSCLVTFECAHVRKGGRVPPIRWIDQLGNMCSSSEDIFLHCDGTRIINASLALNVPLSRLVRSCDSVTLGLDKSLGAPLGAVLAGTDVFISRAAYIRDFMGGHIHQAGTFAAAGSFALQNGISTVDWDHEKAKAIAIDLTKEGSSIVSVDINHVETNVIHLHCNPTVLTAKHLKDRLASVSEDESNLCGGQNIILLCEAVNNESVSLMLHNKVSHSDVLAAIRKLLFVIREYEDSSPPKLIK